MRYLAFFLGVAAAASGCDRAEGPASMQPEKPATTPANAPKGVGPLSAPPAWLQQAREDASQTCYIDMFEGAEHGADGWSISSAAPARAVGWAVDASAVEQPDAYLELRNTAGESKYFKVERSDRPDVNAAPQFAKTKLANVGLAVPLDLAQMPKGRYDVALIVGDEGGVSRCTFEADTVLNIK